ncbi:MAG: glycosyltransferase 87 family protein, partial [Methanococcaceae archaeon]
IVACAGILFRLSVLPFPATASDDIYRYVWDGKVAANGINPYRYAPDDQALNFLHSDILPKNVNFPSMKTIYPPYAQMIFFTSYKIFGENFTGFKLFLLLSEMLTLWLLYLLLKELKLPLYNIALYALCPLPIMQFMIDGHVDGLGLPLFVLSLLLFFKRKKIWFMVSLGLSISTKLISGMILPFTAMESDKNYLKKAIAFFIPLVVFALSYIPFLSHDVFPFESLMTFTANWSFNSSSFALFFNILPDNQKARIISGILFLLVGIWLFFSKKGIRDKIYYIFLFFLLLSPTVHPWYLNWLAVILPISFKLSGLAFVTLINIANIVVIDYKLKGIWELSSWLQWVEYLPVYLLLFWELGGSRLWNRLRTR